MFGTVCGCSVRRLCLVPFAGFRYVACRAVRDALYTVCGVYLGSIRLHYFTGNWLRFRLVLSLVVRLHSVRRLRSGYRFRFRRDALVGFADRSGDLRVLWICCLAWRAFR